MRARRCSLSSWISGSLGIKICLYLQIPIVVMLGIIFLRTDVAIGSRAYRWCLQFFGASFTVLLPWKYAYPQVGLSSTKFSAGVFLVWLATSLTRMLKPFTRKSEPTENSSEPTENSEVYYLNPAVSGTIFEICIYFSLFAVFPFFYRKSFKRQTNMVFIAYFCVFYGLVSGILMSWGRKTMYEYSFTAQLIIIMAIISHNPTAHDRSQNAISCDWGYIVLLGLSTLALPDVLGMAMEVLLPSTSTLYDQAVMLMVWTAVSMAYRAMWLPIARRALTPFLAPTFAFPLQLAVDIYDELIFIVCDFRSAGFAVLLLLRASVNFLRNSGFWDDFVEFFFSQKNARLWRCGGAQAAAIAAVDEDGIGGALERDGPVGEEEQRDRLCQQMHFLEQNSISESLASLTVLSAVLFDMLLDRAGVGENSVNYNLTPTQVRDTLITYSIVSVTIFAVSVVSHAVLVKKFNKKVYGEAQAPQLPEERTGAGQIMKTIAKKMFPEFVIHGSKPSRSQPKAKFIGTDDAFLGSSMSSSAKHDNVTPVHPLATAEEAKVITDNGARRDIEEDGAPAYNAHPFAKVSADAGQAEENTNSDEEGDAAIPSMTLISQWRPARIHDIWRQFGLYYAATVLYVVLCNLFVVFRIYRKMRAT